MQDAPPEPLMDAKRTRNISDTGVDAEVQIIRHSAVPPARNQNPPKKAYLIHYAIDMAYIHPLEKYESLTAFKKRMYGALYALTITECGIPNMRITVKHPATSWVRVWSNLQHAPISDRLKSTWYVVIHEIVPTNERLAAIHLADTESCTHCGKTD
jgi:hypothetical protein